MRVYRGKEWKSIKVQQDGTLTTTMTDGPAVVRKVTGVGRFRDGYRLYKLYEDVSCQVQAGVISLSRPLPKFDGAHTQII